MNDTAVRNALLDSIDAGVAHLAFDEVVDRFPAEHFNTRPPNVPYSFWALLEHVRICLDRTLEYSFAEELRPLAWPRDYWPDLSATVDEAGWNATVAGIRAGLAEMKRIAVDPAVDLSALARHADGNERKTILHQLVDIIDHNAFHFGEFAILRQVVGNWPTDRE